MIHAGYIHFQLKNPLSIDKVDNLEILSDQLNDNFPLQYEVLDLIKKLKDIVAVTPLNGPTALNLSLRVDILTTEESRGQSASSDLLDLLTFVDRSSDKGHTKTPFVSSNCSNLLDIFVHLPSPKIDKSVSRWCHNTDIVGFLFEDIKAKIPGMKTKLYDYQKNSLWKIAQRELAPQPIEPYEIIELRSFKDTSYYYNQLTGEITLLPPYDIFDAQGGIICEDMGTGKTCICLAVIMLTKDLSNPVHHTDKQLKTDYPYWMAEQPSSTIPSLKHTAVLHMLKSGMNWKPFQSQIAPDIINDWLKKYPIYYEWTNIPSHYDFERTRRLKPVFTTLKVYLANTTLVVVPDNLIAQWTGEIYKHIEDRQLKFVVYDDTKQKISSPIQLIDYDLVLISQNRFSHEYSVGGLDYTSYICHCSSRTPTQCTCDPSKHKYVSPLLQVHWKRLIVDEGHRLSAKNRQAELSAKLFSNWKWICTGTPTQNLTESASAHTRQDSELDDLNRLGALFGQTLGIEPFKSNKKLWSRLIVQPFLKRKPWAICKLTQMMERVMVRNQRADMDKEVTLPPLYRKTVYLDFDYYQWIAHNCQIAMISLNAILSKREGADYLFSTKNQKSLRETVHNLWQSCLWHSVEPSLIQSAYNNCAEKCKQVTEGKADYGEKDNEDLFRIQSVLEHALNNKMFLCIMTHHSPSYVVQGLPALFRETWGWLQGDHGAYIPVGSLPWDDYCIINADRVIDAMDKVTSARSDDTQDLFVYLGNKKILISVEEFEAAKKRKTYQEAQLKKKKAAQQKQKERQQMVNVSQSNQQQHRYLADKTLPGAAVTPTETTDEGKIPQVDNRTMSMEEEPEDQLTFYTRNAFSDARVLSSTSVKINYLVNQVYKYQKTEKCIIFSQHMNEMYEIYLALQLARIRVLLYQDFKMNNVKRSQMILTFNTSQNANVIIMAVQKAAYGIDLSSATRVYFVSPVWQPAMEQQAIKRAHRIGQKKSVYVETLIIKSTIEDALLQRRDQVSSGTAMNHQNGAEENHDKENLKKGDFYADSKLKDILNHAHFVPVPERIIQDTETSNFHQTINPLDAPLEFIPKKTAIKVKEEEQKLIAANDNSSTTTVGGAPVHFSDNAPAIENEPVTADQKTTFDVDNDIIDIEMDEVPGKETDIDDTEQMVLKSGEESTEPMIKIEDDPLLDIDGEPLLDIEGNHDAQDHLQAWKLRLIDQASREKAAESKSQTAPDTAITADRHILQSTKDVSGPSEPPPISEDISGMHDNIHENRPKKKRKTVSFAF